MYTINLNEVPEERTGDNAQYRQHIRPFVESGAVFRVYYESENAYVVETLGDRKYQMTIPRSALAPAVWTVEKVKEYRPAITVIVWGDFKTGKITEIGERTFGSGVECRIQIYLPNGGGYVDVDFPMTAVIAHLNNGRNLQAGAQ